MNFTVGEMVKYGRFMVHYVSEGIWAMAEAFSMKKLIADLFNISNKLRFC